MIEAQNRISTILLVEDDEEDRWVTRRAFERSGYRIRIIDVEDGQKALDCLGNKGEYGDRQAFPRPDLILLDLNMPNLDGREVLRIVKADPDLHRIPVVVMTTSSREEDIMSTYELGVSSYITKPVDLEEFQSTIRDLGHYWLELVVLPPRT